VFSFSSPLFAHDSAADKGVRLPKKGYAKYPFLGRHGTPPAGAAARRMSSATEKRPVTCAPHSRKEFCAVNGGAQAKPSNTLTARNTIGGGAAVTPVHLLSGAECAKKTFVSANSGARSRLTCVFMDDVFARAIRYRLGKG
jgi:hypothetical protein